jgi:hypothetical protein
VAEDEEKEEVREILDESISMQNREANTDTRTREQLPSFLRPQLLGRGSGALLRPTSQFHLQHSIVPSRVPSNRHKV